MRTYGLGVQLHRVVGNHTKCASDGHFIENRRHRHNLQHRYRYLWQPEYLTFTTSDCSTAQTVAFTSLTPGTTYTTYTTTNCNSHYELASASFATPDNDTCRNTIAVNNTIIRINLPNLGLDVTIPNTMGDLTGLTHLPCTKTTCLVVSCKT